jgi:hypothetical protein
MSIEHVPAELRGEDGKVYNVQLDITPKEVSADEESMPLYRVPDTRPLSRNSGKGVPDGKYELTYTFDGRPYKEKVRMVGGELRGGW